MDFVFSHPFQRKTQHVDPFVFDARGATRTVSRGGGERGRRSRFGDDSKRARTIFERPREPETRVLDGPRVRVLGVFLVRSRHGAVGDVSRDVRLVRRRGLVAVPTETFGGAGGLAFVGGRGGESKRPGI